MNTFDVVIVAVAAAAAAGGWRLGFLARLLGWVGVAVGLGIGILTVPGVVTRFGGTTADDRVTVALVFLVLVATVGQGLGLAVGALLPRVRPPGTALADRVAGALLGVTGVLALVWMVVPSLATAEGWPARAARGSSVVAFLDRVAPEQPERFAAWGRSISNAPFPSALRRLEEPPDPGLPPSSRLDPSVDAHVRAATVKVEGNACRRIQEGSGWVAAPGLVVTNAHVVAGEDATTVESPVGGSLDATVVAFDPVRDLAVLSVPGLGVEPLPRGDGAVGMEGAVYGHPGGEALQASPARIGEEITAIGTDIYRTGESRRQVFVLAAQLEPGDSGGPLVAPDGTVVGVAFAIDPGRPGTAYALTDAEVDPVLADAGGPPVDTGHCLVG